MGEVRLDDENRHHQRLEEARLRQTGSETRRLPSRTALKIAWGDHDGYHVVRNRVHMGNVR